MFFLDLNFQTQHLCTLLECLENWKSGHYVIRTWWSVPITHLVFSGCFWWQRLQEWWVNYEYVLIFFSPRQNFQYVHNMIFWALFSIIYIASMLLVSLEFYFKGIWTLNLRELRNSIRLSWVSSRHLSCVVPAYKARFFVILLLNIANTAV